MQKMQDGKIWWETVVSAGRLRREGPPGLGRNQPCHKARQACGVSIMFSCNSAYSTSFAEFPVRFSIVHCF
jgi:hypothetical protein